VSAGDLERALRGFAFVENPRMVRTRLARRPRSKKYRIRKKWAKRPGNLAHEPSTDLYYMAEKRVVIGHPAAIAALRARISESAAAARREAGHGGQG